MFATFQKYTLTFKRPAGTSRGVLKTKDTYFLKIESEGKVGIGECSVFRGLSFDDVPNYEEKLQWACDNINLGLNSLVDELKQFPSIQFGVEMAFLDLKAKNSMHLYPSNFTDGNDAIPINGLVWMGDFDFMQKQIVEKLNSGFSCVKMKIGAIDFNSEIKLLKKIRKEFTPDEVELRVDANGAFSKNEALEKLKVLSEFNIHSIEQPIKQGQINDMARLCETTPLDIALDEELIGVIDLKHKKKLIDTINPQYIILKPSLVGGIKGSMEWINIAKNNKIDWWITSALESNIGLNAIAQWTYTLNNSMPQGLGTGSLFTNNITSPLEVRKGALYYNSKLNWDLSNILK